ncbi:MAG: hypothetical protein M1818_002393 [Claussenomyces sp. TS43310]|nr:MAG: hypothetical protein M1818_002393 [Claussenomyces sp. TS43310]
MDSLPLELIQKIFKECPDIATVISLARVSKKYYAALHGTQKLSIFNAVINVQFAPLGEAIQLVTYNDSEPAHQQRSPAISMALVKQIVKIGNVANQWVEIYPMLRWRSDTTYRRVLRPHEVLRFRRALYRIWLYGKAFHSPSYLSRDEDPPMSSTKDDRLTFFRRYSDDHIIEISEVHDVFHEMLHNDICPSNAIMMARYAQAAPGQDPLFFGTYETFRLTNGRRAERLLENVSVLDLPRNLAREAWGSRQAQKSIVLDLLKLTPDELLYLRDLGGKLSRIEYLSQLDPLFHNSRATLKDALEAVFAERDLMLGITIDLDGGVVDFFEEESGERNSMAGVEQEEELDAMLVYIGGEDIGNADDMDGEDAVDTGDYYESFDERERFDGAEKDDEAETKEDDEENDEEKGENDGVVREDDEEDDDDEDVV